MLASRHMVHPPCLLPAFGQLDLEAPSNFLLATRAIKDLLACSCTSCSHMVTPFRLVMLPPPQNTERVPLVSRGLPFDWCAAMPWEGAWCCAGGWLQLGRCRRKD